ncbi:hypothetical protein F2Q65_15560 [Thiohalocapsa marina]|uniref:DUF5666 domain-containing protein n=1 Tax=Thiohalocapsa marina TaxID=424902 RepID=A0A5M8FFL2_9GAMM|nr:hypothetical protein [Thiohalocapsa marina]KAA6183479.1 hypothetical protein F2Q65_15560 [Thiohalocapsa marina]
MIKPVSLLLTAAALTLPVGAQADDDFYGVIESQPTNGHIGEWVIGGRTFSATARTQIDEDDGPLLVGTCASVDWEGGMVEEIESEDASECAPVSVN